MQQKTERIILILVLLILACIIGNIQVNNPEFY
jgi:hypothetical protein